MRDPKRTYTVPNQGIAHKRPDPVLDGGGSEIRRQYEQEAQALPVQWRSPLQLRERPSKRAFDIVVSVGGLVLLSPLLALIWVAVRLSSSGPGIYWSERLGREGIPFWMPKFRSMRQAAPTMPREAMSDASHHITPLGHVLRLTSLDELPQLWSILVGDMSLIGPRPLLPSDPGVRARWDFADAIKIRPGLTGLAQVRGRNLVQPRDKARYDAFYARRGCWSLDVRIAVLTFAIVVLRRGIV